MAQLKDTIITGDLSVTGNYNGALYYVAGTGGTNAGDWIAYLSQVSKPYTGLTLAYKIPKAGNGSSTARTLTNDDGTTVSATYTWLKFNGKWYKCYYGATDNLTTHYNTAGMTVGFIFDATLNSNAGGFRTFADYNTNTTNAYAYLDYYFRAYAGSAIYRYKLVALDKDNRLQPITITNQEDSTQVTKTPNANALRPYKIWYYNTTATISAGSVVGAQTLNPVYYTTACPYNFNADIPAYRLVYLVGDYNATTDMFTLEQTTLGYWLCVPTNTASITLSSYFTGGKYYWLVGGTYSSANYLSLFDNNILYYFDGTNLIPAQGGASATATESATTGISVADHSTTTIYGVQSSTTTASKASGGNGTAPTLGTAFTIPNVTSAGSASNWVFEDVTVPKAATSATTVPIKNASATSIPNVTAVGSGSFSATVSSHVLSFSHAHTAPTLGTAISVTGVQSSTTSVTGVSGSVTGSHVKSGGNGTAPSLGTAFTVPNVTNAGSASTWSFTDVTVPIKNTSTTTVVTSKTHSVTDNGHTHNIS